MEKDSSSRVSQNPAAGSGNRAIWHTVAAPQGYCQKLRAEIEIPAEPSSREEELMPDTFRAVATDQLVTRYNREI